MIARIIIGLAGLLVLSVAIDGMIRAYRSGYTGGVVEGVLPALVGVGVVAWVTVG